MASTSSPSSPAPVPTVATAPPTIHLDSPPRSPTRTMASPPSSPGPQPSPVFAPRPMRIPQLFRPRPLVALEGSTGNQMRTPSPKQQQQRRSSSAAGGMKALVLTDAKLVGGETSEVQLKIDDGEGSNNGVAGELQPMQLYSPSKDVLDELYKIIRNNKPQPRAFDHKRQLSDASSSKDSNGREENTRSPLSHEFGRIPFPSSPVSRTLMRNPIIFNSQFGQEQH